ncbi:bifunctional 2-polyprenyl-6-hydroxyphenol methylase/3-demethylubiquinol 3-O-methyltransferase UbiG [Kitasatospora sp. SUK 42]|uniref:class I SAM-dependent methyltransferase n=1 Tax=Kitasatospora sp. SUK 42 TaxID=1588882 RepID=UPI0018C92FC5|nr:class I SAM-dependent methyltransferase [Kitasatospora sp. SUK 42]MBV2155422.1 class I SAM-dependent methyltransferase [Kitasatospora sp. SUK 42]
MPFNHNDHYHDLLLREIPASCRRALEVGCGTGGFAQKLARLGIEVDAIDADGDVIAAARGRNSLLDPSGRIHFEQADITRLALPPNTYDYIACLASIHHVPFETVRKLRASLTPNGVLVILGCYREATLRDHAVGLLAVPVNAAWRIAVFFREKTRPDRHTTPDDRLPPAPVTPPSMSLPEIREASADILPGRRIQRLLFWRYLLVFHNAGSGAGK